MDDNCFEFVDDRNDERMMDALLLFVMPPVVGYGIYLIMKNDFFQFMFEYIKRKIKEERHNVKR